MTTGGGDLGTLVVAFIGSNLVFLFLAVSFFLIPCSSTLIGC